MEEIEIELLEEQEEQEITLENEPVIYSPENELVTLTQDEYDALEPKNDNTYYFIVEE